MIEPDVALDAVRDVATLTELAVTDTETLLTLVGRCAGSLVGGVAVVALAGSERTLLRVAAVTAADPDLAAGIRAGLAGAPLDTAAVPAVDEAVRQARPVAGRGGLGTLLHQAGRDGQAWPGEHLLAVPVVLRAEVIGVLCTISAEPPPAAAVGQLAELADLCRAPLQVVRERAVLARRSEHARILVAWAHNARHPQDGPADPRLVLVESVAAALHCRCWLVTLSGEVVAGGPRPAPAAPPTRTLRLPLGSASPDDGRLSVSRPAPFDSEDRLFLEAAAAQVRLAWDLRESARERDAAVTALRLSEQRFRLAFDAAPAGIALVQLRGPNAGTVVESNRAMQELCGMTAEELRRVRYTDLVHPDERDIDTLRLAQFASGERQREDREKRLLRPDGTQVWVMTRLAVIHRDGRPWWAVVHAADVTARKLAQEQLEHQALHDPLTGLGNRSRLLDHLRLALHQLDRHPGVVAVLFLDLDRFKAINDAHGHAAGDTVLRAVAARIGSVVRAPDTVARIAGDEFVIAVTVHAEADAAQLAERIQQALAPPVELDGAERLEMTASLGVATSRSSATDPDELLRRADLAMYHAKHDPHRAPGPHGGRRWQVYHEGLGHRARQRDDVLRMLRTALRAGWLRLLFQPIVELASGRVVAAEALLRLAHPERGLLAPAAFIDIAEANDVILPIGQWVLTEALRPLRDWQRYGVQVGVNVSARQVARRVVGEQVRAAASAAGYLPGEPVVGLRLEVTERVALQADDDVVADLRELSERGVRLALDDFGTGYASLLHVRRLPVDELKIDGSFVRGLGIDPDDTAIVRAVAALAGSLGLDTVAEGVERAEQLPLLRELGCRHAQGYLLGAPMDEAAFTRLLTTPPP